MPLYESQCLACGLESEYIETMARSAKVPRCRQCGGKCVKIVSVAPAVYGDLNDFAAENGGRGRYNHQLRQYVTSVGDAIGKASKRGWSVLDKA